MELPEFLLLGKEIDIMMGIGGKAGMTAARESQRRKLLRKKFRKVDVDGDGALDTLEVMGLMMDVVKLRKQQARTAELFENLWLNCFLVVVIYCVGAVQPLNSVVR